MIKVVDFNKNHFDWVVEVAAKKMLEEHLKRPGLYDPQSLLNLCRSVYNHGIGFIAEEYERPVGIIAGLLLPSLFNINVKTLAEIVWFVEEDYRNTRAGLLLLNKFTEAGQYLNCDVTLSILPSTKVELSTLERKGYVLEEYGLRKGQ